MRIVSSLVYNIICLCRCYADKKAAYNSVVIDNTDLDNYTSFRIVRLLKNDKAI